MRRDLFWALAFLVFTYPLVSCHGGEKPARTAEEIAASCAPLAEVEAQFIGEVLELCADADPEHPELCPAFTGIDAKYQPLRLAAVRKCQ